MRIPLKMFCASLPLRLMIVGMTRERDVFMLLFTQVKIGINRYHILLHFMRRLLKQYKLEHCERKIWKKKTHPCLNDKVVWIIQSVFLEFCVSYVGLIRVYWRECIDGNHRWFTASTFWSINSTLLKMLVIPIDYTISHIR